MEQVHILYSGRVQGVGFRFSVHRYAKRLQLTGWVKNLVNGEVEIIAEGSRENLATLCSQIENHFEGNIKDKSINYRPAEGRYQEFLITT